MTPEELRRRLIIFAADAGNFAKPFFRRRETEDAASQLTRAASGAMANHRAAGRARSHKEFTAVLGKAVEEIDEAQAWLEYFEGWGAVDDDNRAEHERLTREVAELTAILTASFHTARRREEANRTLKPRK